MKILANLCLAITIALGSDSVAAKEPVRLDGTTEATFEVSFTKLVRSLKVPERRSLALGLFGALVKHECLAPETVVRLTFMPVEPKDGALIHSCREHLHGMSYAEILQAGEPSAEGPPAQLPNNSFKPKPLRGSA